MSQENQSNVLDATYDRETQVLSLDVRAQKLPSLEELKGYIKQGLSKMSAKLVLDSAKPLPFLRQIEFLRDCLSLGILVEWEGTVEGEAFDVRPFFHLVPPTAWNAESTKEEITEWEAKYRFGTFYWRKGNDFLLVKDVRFEGRTNRFVIDDQAMGHVMQQCMSPIHRDQLQVDDESLQPLLEEGLLYECRGYLLTLPYRVLKWPVPYNAI